jgi:hypothetical protein
MFSHFCPNHPAQHNLITKIQCCGAVIKAPAPGGNLIGSSGSGRLEIPCSSDTLKGKNVAASVADPDPGSGAFLKNEDPDPG